MKSASVQSAPQARSAIATAVLETLTIIRCCSWTAEISTTAEVPATSGGRELGKAVCDGCGSEYLIGIIARTREESLAAEVFEQVADEVLDKAGVDRSDFEPSPEDPKMCVRCDGDAGTRDYCRGCNEYVHLGCRGREPRRARGHMAEEHWEEPKFPSAKSAGSATSQSGTGEDDGSRLTGDDGFVVEE